MPILNESLWRKRSGVLRRLSRVFRIPTDAAASQAVARSFLVNISIQGNARNVQFCCWCFQVQRSSIGRRDSSWTILWTWSFGREN